MDTLLRTRVGRITSDAEPFSIVARDEDGTFMVGVGSLDGHAVTKQQMEDFIAGGSGGDFASTGWTPMTADFDLAGFMLNDVSGVKPSYVGPNGFFDIEDNAGAFSLLTLYAQVDFAEWDFYFAAGADPSLYNLQLTSHTNVGAIVELRNLASVGNVNWLFEILDVDGSLLLRSDAASPIALAVGAAADLLALDATGIGFYGVAPVAQAAPIADVAGGATVDVEMRDAIADILQAVRNLGIVAV